MSGIYVAHQSQHAQFNGKPFTVVGPALSDSALDAVPGAPGDDAQTWNPAYRIRFADGTEIDAWPEEVEVLVDLTSDDSDAHDDTQDHSTDQSADAPRMKA